VSEVKKCGYCKKTLDVGCFSTNPKTSALYSKCEVCRPKHAASSNSSANSAEAKRAFKASEAGKEADKRYKQSEAGKEADKRYKQSEAGKEADKRYKQSEAGKEAEKRHNATDSAKESKKEYKQSEAGKEADKRYNQSEAGKEADKRYREGDAGQETAKRFAANRKDRRRASTAMQMDGTIQCASNKLISGRTKTSPTFVERTGFASESAFLAAVEATFQPGMAFANHGPVWELDHKIPREAYDFDDPEDVRRCWSPKNVHALTRSANAEKSWKLVDQYIFEAGVECLPVAWNDRLPDADFKNAHAAKMLARKILQDEAAAEVEEEEQPSSSSGLFVEEAPDSDSD
jgi:hypothetical protein